MQKTALHHHQKSQPLRLRQARTRTLIQAGGLLNQLGFLDYCGIATGEDLQQDFISGDKAAVLLGILMKCYEALPDDISEAQWAPWKATGFMTSLRFIATVRSLHLMLLTAVDFLTYQPP